MELYNTDDIFDLSFLSGDDDADLNKTLGGSFTRQAVISQDYRSFNMQDDYSRNYSLQV
jgi:hypothetical protein